MWSVSENVYTFLYVCYPSIKSLLTPSHPPTHQNKILSMFLITSRNISKPWQYIQCSLWYDPGHLLPVYDMCAIYTRSRPVFLARLCALALVVPSAWNSSLYLSLCCKCHLCKASLDFSGQTSLLGLHSHGMLLFPLSGPLALSAYMCFLDWW